MKKITLLFMFICAIIGVNAQQTINFETVGADLIWSDLSNMGAVPVVIDNPVKGTGNFSEKVLHFALQDDTRSWAGGISNVDLLTVNNSGLIRMDVYKPVLSNTGFKLEVGNAGGTGTATEVKVQNETINAWETLEFDFTQVTGSTYSKIIIMPEFTDFRVGIVDVYVDNIEFFSIAASVYQEELDDSKVYKSGDKVIYKSSTNITEVFVLNIGGSMVLKDTRLNGELNISSLQKGVYLVVLKSGKTRSAFKIVK